MIRDRKLLALLTAEVVSGLGTRMTWLALPWFVLVETGSATRMGVVYAAELLPMAVLGIPMGTLVQRLGGGPTVVGCEPPRGAPPPPVPVLPPPGGPSFPPLLVLLPLLGVFSAPA